jgi:uncharacterized membrane protein YdjX (TVP38/TMEM64 family)
MSRIAARAVLFVAFILVLLAGIWLSPLKNFIHLRNLVEVRDSLKFFVSGNYILAVVIFIAVYIAAVACAVPGVALLSMLGGLFFGSWPATLYINLGATGGAVCIFLSTRRFLGRAFQARYAAQLVRFNHELRRNGWNYLLTVRLTPFIPFFLVNVLSGLTRVPLATFIWTTSLGIIPAGFFYASIGELGTRLDPLAALSPVFLLIRLGLAVFVIGLIFARRWWEGRKTAS